VVLASGAVTGDLITVVSLYMSSVTNGIPATSGAVVSSYLASGLTLSGTTTANTITSASGSALSLQSNGGTTAITVDTSQNVGIGTASPAVKLSVAGAVNSTGNYTTTGYSLSIQPSPNTQAAYTSIVNGAGTAYIGADSSTGSSFGTAGNYGSIWWRPTATDLAISCSSDVNLRIKAAGTLILQGGNASATGVGIAFPATQSASSDPNTLDDYEEGGWTPTFTDGNGHNATSYYYQYGTYVKIGRQVWVNCTISILSLGALNGGVKITGLPFTSSYQSSPFEAYQVACASFPAPTGSSYPGMTFADLEANGNTFVTIWYVGNGGWSAQNANVYSGGQQLHFNLTYFTNN
jgi:hypothetical protein